MIDVWFFFQTKAALVTESHLLRQKPYNLQVHLLNYLIKYFSAMDYWTSNYNTIVLDNTKKTNNR